MIDQEQLNGLYDPDGIEQADKPRPKVKTSSAPVDYLSWREGSGQNMSRAGSSFKVSGVDAGDQKKLFGDTGIYDPGLTEQDILLEAGARQSFGNKLMRRAVNLVPNVAASILDMVGNVGSLLTEWGDERDYYNGMNAIADSIKNPLGESYARTNDTWDLASPTWWLNNIADLTEFATGFAIGGAGAAKAIGAGVEGIVTAANVGVRGSRLLAAAGELGTSGLVSYAESAQAGTQVYKEVYANQLQKLIANGLDPQEAAEQAKHIAAQSAATTAQLGTLLTMGINSGAYSSFFKSPANNARDIIARRIAQSTGTGTEIAGIIRGMNATDYLDKLLHHSGIRARLTEMFKEGTEEVLQQFAQQTGTDVGNTGQTRNFISQFGEIEHLINRTANSQGLLSFVLGAGFGGLQNVLLHNVIPSRRVNVVDGDTEVQRMNGDSPVTDANGIPVMRKKWVTPRSNEVDFTKRKFDSLKESLAYDFENFDRINNDILKAVAKGDTIAAEQARNELFDTGRLHAIKQGLTEPWKKTFSKIAEMTPQQAMEAGYINDKSDLSYQQKANKAISDMDHLTDVYNKLNKRFGSNEANQPYIDMLFARHADIYNNDQLLQDYEKQIIAAEKETEELARVTDMNAFSKALNDHVVQGNSFVNVEKQLIEDHDLLLNGNNKDVERLLRKYRAVGYGDGDTAAAIQVLSDKLKAKQAEVINAVKATEDALLHSNDFLLWQEKHPAKNFNDFMNEVIKRNTINAQNMAMREQLEAARLVNNIAKENLQEMTSDKSIGKFSKKAAEWEAAMALEAERAEQMRIAKLAEMLKDKQTLNRLDKMELNRLAEGYRETRDNVYSRINNNNTLLKELKVEFKASVEAGTVFYTKELSDKLKGLVKENELLFKQWERLNTLYQEYQVDTSIDNTPVNEEDITGEQDGKITESTNEFPSTNTQASEPTTVYKAEPPIIEPVPAQGTLELEEDAVSSDDPIQKYTQLYSSLSPAIKGQLTRLVKGLIDGSKTPSLDYFNNQVAKGKLTQEKALQILDAAADYAKAIQNAQAVKAEEDFIEAQPAEPVKKDEIEVSGISIPDTPEIDNVDEDTPIPEAAGYHAGYKIIEAAGTGATSTIGYKEGTRIGKKGEIVYFKVTEPGNLNTGLNEDILKPGKLLPGHPLRYEVDVEYNGPKLITDSLSWDNNGDSIHDSEKGADYLDKNGKVITSEAMLGNVPIKVVDDITGKLLFYIRKLDWLEAKFPGTTDYRNVVDTIYTADGDAIDNFAIQRKGLLEIRKAIVDKYNIEGKAGTGQIGMDGKGTGRLILNHVTTGSGSDLKSKVEKGFAYNKSNPEKSLLPDTSLTLVIADSGNVLNKGLKSPFTEPLGFVPDNIKKGSVGAMVPAANGQFMYAPLIGQRIVEENKPSPGLNSVVRAIELYLLDDGTDPQISAEINNIESNTGFNLSTARGLKAFISQYYTYSQNFPDSALSPNAKGEKTERFLFSIDDKTDILDKTKQIKAGWSMRGDGVKYANLVNGSLDTEFIGKLRDGFTSRSRAINYSDSSLGLKGINSLGTFTDATYVPGKGWKHEQYKNYNEYVKSWSRTPVYGRNQLSDGTYVYTANPQLPINIDALIEETQVTVEPNNSVESLFDVIDQSTPGGFDNIDNIVKQRTDIERRRQEELKSAEQKWHNSVNERGIPTYSIQPINAEINAKYDAKLAALETDKTTLPPTQQDNNLLDDWFNQSLSRHVVPSLGTGSDQSQELTMAALEKIYNFTPERQRNGKTVKEVFTDLKGRGHTYLSEGFNPFSRCL